MERACTKNIEYGLLELNKFNSTPDFGTSRILFTPEELAGREFVKSLMSNVGLEVEEDGIGNIFATLPGTEPELAPVWSGSHIDTVPNAGMFDGMTGVIGAIEALRLIKGSGIDHKRTIKAVVYTSEEPTRFGLSCLGSRALAGILSYDDAEKLHDRNGKTLASVLQEIGHTPEEFDTIKKKPNEVFAAVELHIEQGATLYDSGKKIALVKTICAPSNYIIKVEGKQSHAGGTSMTDRCDAMTAAAELILEVERLAKADRLGEYTTATVGKIDIVPNAMNVIPGEVIFTLDIRYTDEESEQEIVSRLKKFCTEIEKSRGVKISIEMINRDIPVKCAPELMKILKKYSLADGHEIENIISGAYHDSLMVGKFAPVAMLFVPSKNGISHCPDEWTDFSDVALGVDVLAKSLLEIANM